MIGKKIAIVGAHGTGKTAFAYSLAANLKAKRHINVGVTQEGARSSPYLIAGDSISPEAEVNVFARQLVHETDLLRTHELVICDRSPIEVVAYSRLLIPRLRSKKDARYIRATEKFARDYMKTYDSIFRMTVLFNPRLTNDPMRPLDEYLQLDVHRVLKTVLDKFEVKYTDVPAEQQVDFVIRKLEDIRVISK